MWALMIFMLMPTGTALAAKEVKVYPTEEAYKHAAPDEVFELANAIVEATQIPLAAMKPLVACSKTDMSGA